ncbi:MAG: tRNA preQ1(34) S-adenosylmethionine ribosyltransferase-isomerase QueA [Candidatus Omnitrophica bacterium]|nr:tRNA preQ1(34) S-adenosylmethionine ribosyltransferase-isomerase QueA [Candidatus Omnitrophota bacterium]
MYKLTEFNYRLPEELIAQEPLRNRDQARLLVVDRKKKAVSHDTFENIGQYLPKNSLVVLNNTKVIPARLLGVKERSGGQVEIFLLNKLKEGCSYETLMRPMRRIKDGDVVSFGDGKLKATVVDKDKKIVRFNRKDVLPYLERIGHVPLPPYIKRADTKEDREFYQTVYARHAGSVAAPTAGLHFTKPLLSRLKKQGHDIVNVTLHVNYATFKPVEEPDIRTHKMHIEEYSASKVTWEKVQQAKKDKRKIVAVGTTSCRVLEAVAQTGKIKGKTNLFIYPGYKFQCVDTLITNFHLPFSSLLMLVYAFGSSAVMKKAYNEAVKSKYRFYSYGDGMVIV